MREPHAARGPRDAAMTANGTGEMLVCGVVLGAAAGAVLLWLAGGLSSLETGHGFQTTGLHGALGLFVGVLGDPGSPRSAWPPSLRADIGTAPVFYATLAGLLLPFAALGRSRLRRAVRVRAGGSVAASWARPGELKRLVVSAPGAGRLVIGAASGRLLATEAGHSLLVIGPSQSGKTSGLAIPALLEWDGPVLATSVKADLLWATQERRSALGTVTVFDPMGMTSCGSPWSPLGPAREWSGARRVAASLCSVARNGASGLDDSAFWYATAEKLLAPLLYAAASGGASMGDVVRWVDTGEEFEVLELLERAGNAAAARAARASFGRDERQLSSVYTTTETVLAAFSDPHVLETAAHGGGIDPSALLDGGKGSLFVLGPSHHQERLAPVFVALVTEVLEQAFDRASRSGGRLDPGLLVVLDEAANVAPLPGLDTLASTAASHGIELVTVFQDVAQIETRYGPRAATVVNNHRAKLVLSGVADPATLELMSSLIGEQLAPVGSTTTEEGRRRSTTWSTERRRLAPSDWLRRLEPGEGVLLYGHLPPCRLRLRPYFSERRRRVVGSGRERSPGALPRVPRPRRRGRNARPGWRSASREGA